jgi:beta-barrel assembly-enhancing protease
MKKTFLILSVALLSFAGCKKGDLNLFSIEDDKSLGQQTVSQILANPQQYPVLSRTQYPQQYAYLDNMRNEILNSGQVRYKTEFEWQLYIINDPNTQNAFCTPGGYIFIYTGLIKYLDNASSLAGVLGHEMAHADRRHSTTQMTKQYGLQTLLDIVLGNNQSALTDVAASLVNLQFSRDDEKDADAQSVTYLCPTVYRADGSADFFVKIAAGGGQQVPAFLSTHPNPDNRVTNIQTKKTELGCANSPSNTVEITDYTQFKNSLP